MSNLSTLVSISDLETILATVPELVPYPTSRRRRSSSSGSSIESGGGEDEYYDYDESFADSYISNNDVSQQAAACSNTFTNTTASTAVLVVGQAGFCNPTSFQVLQPNSPLHKSNTNLACIDTRRTSTINHLIKKWISLKIFKTAIIR